MTKKQSYSSNFSKLCLLSNSLIKINFNLYSIHLRIPNVNQLFNDEKFIKFLTILSNQNNLWTNNGFFIANNAYELLLGMDKFIDKISFKEIWDYIFPNLVLDNRSIKCGDINILPEHLAIAVDMLLVGCNYKTYESLENNDLDNEELSEWDRKMKENEERIRKVKEKNDSNKKIEMDEIFISIIHIFSQYTIENLMGMNYFSIMYLYKWSQKILVQKINDIAAGNGLAKNYKPLFN